MTLCCPWMGAATRNRKGRSRGQAVVPSITLDADTEV